MQATSEISVIEINPDSSVGVRIAKIVASGDVVVSRAWHRVRITADNAEEMIAACDADLIAQGYPALCDWQRVRDTVAFAAQ